MAFWDVFRPRMVDVRQTQAPSWFFLWLALGLIMVTSCAAGQGRLGDGSISTVESGPAAEQPETDFIIFTFLAPGDRISLLEMMDATYYMMPDPSLCFGIEMKEVLEVGDDFETIEEWLPRIEVQINGVKTEPVMQPNGKRERRRLGSRCSKLLEICYFPDLRLPWLNSSILMVCQALNMTACRGDRIARLPRTQRWR